MTPLRIGLIGARRARQGLGPFVARDLCAAGAELRCFLTTRTATRDEAGRRLEELVGPGARGYTDLSRMLADQRLDALAICSPHESHEGHLQAALEAGLHVLCEKPLVWGRDDLAATARRLVERFAERGLALWENCQWPYTLPAFERLHPGALGAPPRSFHMLLQPAGRGLRMLADSLPHPLSLLQRLAPAEAPQLRGLRFASADPEAPRERVQFVYAAEGAEIEVSVELRPSQAHPRETRLEIDGHCARREVSPQDYRLSFEDAGRSVPLEDPLTRLVTDFAQRARIEEAALRRRRGREIVARMAMLGEIAAAYRRAARA